MFYLVNYKIFRFIPCKNYTRVFQDEQEAISFMKEKLNNGFWCKMEKVVDK